VALVLIGLAMRIAAGWEVGVYLAGAAVLALLVTLDKP
jgi:Zn-dependent membrane protease YugP